MGNDPTSVLIFCCLCQSVAITLNPSLMMVVVVVEVTVMVMMVKVVKVTVRIIVKMMTMKTYKSRCTVQVMRTCSTGAEQRINRD